MTQRLRPRSQESEVILGMRLIRWKWLEMIAKRELTRTARLGDSERQVEHSVRCECGFGREEADMVKGIVIE